ncbi:MAG: hemolysin family protein [Chitinophagales bacterium]
MDANIAFLVLIVTLLASALFSGLELAYFTASRLRIELQIQQGGIVNKILEFFYNKPTHFLSTTLMGNNLALVIYGIAFSTLFDPPFSKILVNIFGDNTLVNNVLLLVLNTLVSTLLILFLAEFLPKNIFRLFSLKAVNLFILPFGIIYVLLAIPVFIVNAISRFLFWVLRIPIKESEPVFTSLELIDYVKRNNRYADADEEIDTKMFEKALDLTEMRVRECMIPRNEIIAAEADIDFESLRQLFIETKHSKIILYEDNIDNPIGYVHHLDILKGKLPDAPYALIKVPEALSANDLLQAFIKEHKSIAIVVDEAGGTKGLVTLEDIMEEVVGDINDEFDDDDDKFTAQKLSENEYLFSGRMEVDDINEAFDLKLPEGDYETLSVG